MEKLLIILIISSLLSVRTSATSNIGVKDADKWFKTLTQRKEKSVKLHFYVQDVLAGSKATVWEVARANITSRSRTTFGQVRVTDNLITIQPDGNSTKVGRSQGLVTFADLHESALAMNTNFMFSAGEYNGSSLCILGRNPIDMRDRELSVVGGTGVFRMARGFAISNTYSYDPVQNYGVLEFTVYVSYIA